MDNYHGTSGLNQWLGAILLFLLAVLAPTVASAGTPPGFVTVSHFSESLDREASFIVHVPKEAGPDRRYPTLFVLHGAYGSHRDWPMLSPIVELADRYRMILVFPDGGEFGWGMLTAPLNRSPSTRPISPAN